MLTTVLFSTDYTHKEERKRNHYINNETRLLPVNTISSLKFYTLYIIKQNLILKKIRDNIINIRLSTKNMLSEKRILGNVKSGFHHMLPFPN